MNNNNIDLLSAEDEENETPFEFDDFEGMCFFLFQSESLLVSG